jgi:hypothetical protein
MLSPPAEALAPMSDPAGAPPIRSPRLANDRSSIKPWKQRSQCLNIQKARYGLSQIFAQRGSRHLSCTTLRYGVLGPRSIKQRPLSPNTWTCIGALAIPLWATWTSLAIQTLDIPPFESLAIMFFFGWLVFRRGFADLESLGERRCDCASRLPFADRTLDNGLTRGDVSIAHRNRLK